MRLKIFVVIVTCLFIAMGFSCQTALAAIDHDLPQQSIHIHAIVPNPVLERGLFYVEIRDQNNDPVEGATVTVINYNEDLTNGNGRAWFTAPSVSEDTDYTVTAYKYGYAFVGGDKTLTVRNRYLQLLSVLPQMDEQTTDEVWVVNQDGIGVWGAKVTFGCKSDHTNIFGKAVIEAPDVTGDQYVTMTATYSGHDSDSKQVYVIDLDIIPATIHCYVLDASTQEPIQGAIVYIEKLTYGGSIGDHPYLYTNEIGYCCFTVYPDTEGEGTIYKLTATAIGYDPDTEQEHADPGGTYTVVLELPVDEVHQNK